MEKSQVMGIESGVFPPQTQADVQKIHGEIPSNGN